MNLRSPSLPARIAGAVLAVVLAVAGFFLVAGALVLALLATAGAVVWALLRGRRPRVVGVRWPRASRAGQRPRPQSGEVIDIEVREVDETPRR